jgi:hypothetical protein
MLISAALFRIAWLEMRVNMGLFFFVLWAFFAIVLTIGGRFFRFKVSCFRGATLNLFACGIGCFLILGKDRLLTVPAAIIREGLLMPRLAFGRVNAVIGIALLLGWLAMGVAAFKKGARSRAES